MNATSKIRTAFGRHQQRQQCLDLCYQILELITQIQQHRGATLAILAGDVFFETRLTNIKPQVLKSLQEVQALRTHFISDITWESLCAEWFTVNYHWRQDNAFHNFELHTHLIQQLLKLLREFYQSPNFQNLEQRHEQLAQLTLQELPELMETTAQIRGIGTHCLASKASDKLFSDRLGFLSRYFARITDHLDAVYPIEQLLTEQAPWREITDSWPVIEASIKAGLSNNKDQSAESFFNNSSRLVFQARQCIAIGIRGLRNVTDTDIQKWIQSSSLTIDNVKVPKSAN